MTFGLFDFAGAIQKSSFEACTSPPAVRRGFSTTVQDAKERIWAMIASRRASP
jgi:hypothetical protein